MTGEELIEEGKGLARPCIYLTPQQNHEPIAALWGGSGLISPPSEDYQHWLTVDCRFLPEGFEDLSGCLSFYLHSNQEEGWVSHDPSVELSAFSTDGIGLSAHPGLSLPDLDLVFQLGSVAVKEWLSANGWEPEWGNNNNFKDKAVTEAYCAYREPRNPLTVGENAIYAMLGGWHEIWPDSEPEDSLGKRLVVMTYWNAEPYVEVWVDENQQFRVIPRIT